MAGEFGATFQRWLGIFFISISIIYALSALKIGFLDAPSVASEVVTNAELSEKQEIAVLIGMANAGKIFIFISIGLAFILFGLGFYFFYEGLKNTKN